MAKGTQRAINKLNQFRKQAASAGKRARAAMRKQAKDVEVPISHARYSVRLKYADATATIRPLGSISSRWRRRKISLGLDPRRGHAAQGISRTMKSRSLIQKTKSGFVVDLLAPAKTVRRRVSKKKVIRQSVSSYILKYAARKAPGLGNFSKQQLARIAKAGRDALGKQFSKIADLTVVGGTATLKLHVNRLGLKDRR